MFHNFTRLSTNEFDAVQKRTYMEEVDWDLQFVLSGEKTTF